MRTALVARRYGIFQALRVTTVARFLATAEFAVDLGARALGCGDLCFGASAAGALLATVVAGFFADDFACFAVTDCAGVLALGAAFGFATIAASNSASASSA